MAAMILKRLGVSVFVLLAVSLLVFAFTLMLPGDPAQAILGQQATPERLAALREASLDRLADVLEEHLDAAKLRITHLGGGACSMARYFADLYPTSRNTVVELDAKLADAIIDGLRK